MPINFYLFGGTCTLMWFNLRYMFIIEGKHILHFLCFFSFLVKDMVMKSDQKHLCILETPEGACLWQKAAFYQGLHCLLR